MLSIFIPSSPKFRAKKMDPLEDANEYSPVPTFCSHVWLVLLPMGPAIPTNRKAKPYNFNTVRMKA